MADDRLAAGWLVTPPALYPEIGKLIEYNTSCAPDFVQVGGLAARAMASRTSPACAPI